MESLKGKTAGGGISLIVAGAILIARAMGWISLTPEQEKAITEGLALISAGFVAIGLRDAVRKACEDITSHLKELKI